MENNGSPEPVFETNEGCTYFLTVLFSKIEKPEINSHNEAGDNFSDQVNGQPKALKISDLTRIISLYDQAGDQAHDQAKKHIQICFVIF